jgi:hypothetical protein
MASSDYKEDGFFIIMALCQAGTAIPDLLKLSISDD